MWPGLSHNMVARLPEQALRQRETHRQVEGMSPFRTRPQKSHSITSVAFYSLEHNSPSQVQGEMTWTPAPVRSGKVW